AVRLDSGFADLTGGRRFDEWMKEARLRTAAFRAQVESTAMAQSGGQLHAIHIINALREALTEDACLLLDGGSIGQWAHHLLGSERYPSHWLTCGRSGVIGWGIAGAMSARLTYPDRPVVLLAGDGSFTFTVAELECAVRQKLPFVAIVADD